MTTLSDIIDLIIASRVVTLRSPEPVSQASLLTLIDATNAVEALILAPMSDENTKTQRLAARATEGPWETSYSERRDTKVAYVIGPSSNPSIPSPDVVAAVPTMREYQGEAIVATTAYSDRFIPDDNANMEFIADARVAVPRLLSELAYLRSIVQGTFWRPITNDARRGNHVWLRVHGEAYIGYCDDDCFFINDEKCCYDSLPDAWAPLVSPRLSLPHSKEDN